MKKLKILFLSLLFLTIPTVNAQSIGDILKGIGGNGNTTDIIGNVIEGVFTKTNLSLSDLVGSYQSNGPAVTFKSENFLQKAGGIAGAAAIESKLKPYYEKYGLNGMTLTVDQDAAFTMKVKGVSLKGTITKNETEGTFNFNFKVAGVSLGNFTAYIEKSGSSLNLMFDATKLKSLVSTIAKITGNSMASALGSILDSYDGACIGFKMSAVSSDSSTTTTATTESTSSESSSNSNVGNGINALKDILNKK